MGALASISSMTSMKKIDEKEKFFSYSSVSNTHKLKTHLSTLDDADLDLVLNNGYAYPLPGQKPKFPANNFKVRSSGKAGAGQSGTKGPGNHTSSSGVNTGSGEGNKGSKFSSSTIVLGGSSGVARGSTESGVGNVPQKKKRKRKSSVENPKNNLAPPSDSSLMDLT